MGNEASRPKPGTEFRVIGAGHGRTGTASLNEALTILFDAPVYHGGTHLVKGEPADIVSWTRLLRHFPFRTDADRALAFATLKERLGGYAGTTDFPAFLFVPELLELHPDAVVICTVRDPVAWQQSVGQVSSAVTKWFLRAVLFPLPGVRHFVDFINALRDAIVCRTGESEPLTTLTYERHIAWLKEVVPEEKLFFFNVKDGWGPLCAALRKEVPDVPFPQINDREAVERLATETVRRGLERWALIVSALVGAASVFLYLIH